MANLMTLAEIRAHIESDLSDAALTELIDAADYSIVSSVGPHAVDGDITKVVLGGDALLFLPRPAVTFTSVTEVVGDVSTVLATDDYRAWFGNTLDTRILRRLNDGTNPRGVWGNRVSVVYAPLNDDAQRKQVEIMLVRLAVQYRALSSERVGQYSSVILDFQKEQANLIQPLVQDYAGAGLLV